MSTPERIAPCRTCGGFVWHTADCRELRRAAERRAELAKHIGLTPGSEPKLAVMAVIDEAAELSGLIVPTATDESDMLDEPHECAPHECSLGPDCPADGPRCPSCGLLLVGNKCVFPYCKECEPVKTLLSPENALVKKLTEGR